MGVPPLSGGYPPQLITRGCPPIAGVTSWGGGAFPGGYPPQLGRDSKVTKKWQKNRTLRSRRQERPRSSNPAHSKALGVTKRSSASDFLRGATLKSPSRARSNCAPEPSRPTHDGEELTFDGEGRVQRKSYFRWGGRVRVFLVPAHPLPALLK